MVSDLIFRFLNGLVFVTVILAVVRILRDPNLWSGVQVKTGWFSSVVRVILGASVLTCVIAIFLLLAVDFEPVRAACLIAGCLAGIPGAQLYIRLLFYIKERMKARKQA